MTPTAWLLLAAAGVFAVADWYGVAVGDKAVEFVCKPATLAMLVGAAVALEPAHESQRRWFVVALLLSLVGDVFLMLPGRLAAGLVAFLGAHLAYIAGFWPLTGDFPQAWTGSIGVVVITSVVAWLVMPGVRAVSPALVWPVRAYAAVISVMVASAGATVNPLAAAGALLFYASDGLNAWVRFRRPLPWGRLATMVAYHGGQALLVLSLVYGRR